MKNLTTKTILIATSLLGVATLASAHDESGDLGPTLNAIDYYQINCFDNGEGAGNTEFLAVRVKDLAKPIAAPVISAQVTKGRLAVNTTDQVDGDAVWSPEAKVNGGNGSYYVMVDKTKGAFDNYALEAHCKSKLGHTGTTISPLQNK